jgi:hypothetical protein
LREGSYPVVMRRGTGKMRAWPHVDVGAVEGGGRDSEKAWVEAVKGAWTKGGVEQESENWPRVRTPVV